MPPAAREQHRVAREQSRLAKRDQHGLKIDAEPAAERREQPGAEPPVGGQRIIQSGAWDEQLAGEVIAESFLRCGIDPVSADRAQIFKQEMSNLVCRREPLPQTVFGRAHEHEPIPLPSMVRTGMLQIACLHANP